MKKQVNISDKISFEIPTLEKWKEAALKSLKGKSLEELRGERWDGMPLPLTVDSKHVCLASPPRHESIRKDLGNPWEIAQSFKDNKSLLEGLKCGIEAVRTPEELSDGKAMMAFLKRVNPEMISLHVDGYETVGALRAVVAWADGVELVGSAAFGVLVASGSPSCGIVGSGWRFTAAAKRRCWWYVGAATASARDLFGAAPA